MARPLVPDTTAFIEVLHHPDRWVAFERLLRSGRVWLSSVVVAELLAGTRSAQEAREIEGLVTRLERLPAGGRVLTPNASEWNHAGHLISRRVRLHGSVRPRDHIADVLILVSAARLGGQVVTANLRHFQAWASLARAAGLDVVVSASHEES